MIVHRKIWDDLLVRILDKPRDWKTGDPLEPSNALGAIVSAGHFKTVMDDSETGKREGGRPILGGEPIDANLD